MAAFNIGVKLKVDKGGFKSDMDDAARSTEQLGKNAEASGAKIDKAFKKAAAGMVLIGGASIKAAADYERTFSKITGLVGVAKDEVDKMAESTLKLASVAGRGPQELAEAMFVVTSAGQRGAEAMDTLEISAKGAAIGMGETKDIARLVTASMNAYGAENLNAANAMDILTGTVRAGNFETSALAGSLGQILPVASQLGVGLDQVGGGIALLTRNGLGASEAVTQLRSLMTSILAPTVEAQKIMGDLGIEMSTVRDMAAGPEGLVGALKFLYDSVGQSDEQFKRVLGSSEALNGALQILNADAATLEETFGVVADSAGFLDEAFASTADTAGFKMEAAFASIKAAMIELGDAFLPTVALIAEGVAEVVKLFNEVPGPVKAAAAAFVILRGTVGTGSGGGLFAGMVASLKNLNPLLIAAGVAVAIGVKVWGDHQKAAAEAQERTDAFTAALGQVQGSSVQTVNSLVAIADGLDQISGKATEATEELEGVALGLVSTIDIELVELANDFGLSFTDMAAAVTESADALDFWATASQDGALTAAEMNGTLEETVSWIRDKFNPASGELVDGLLEQVVAGDLSVAAFNALISTLDQSADAYKNALDQTKELARETIETKIANEQFENGLVDAIYAMQEAEGGTRNYIEALEILVGHYGGLTEESARMHVETDKVGASSDKASIFLHMMGDEAEFAADGLDGLGDAAEESGNRILDAFEESEQASADLADNILDLIDDVNDAQIELDLTTEEAEAILADFADELLELTDEDYEAILTGDISSLDTELQRALVMVQGFDETEANAILSGDPSFLNAVLIKSLDDLSVFDGLIASADLTADASALFAVIAEALRAVGALDAALGSVQATLKSGGIGEYAFVEQTRLITSGTLLGAAAMREFAGTVDNAAARADGFSRSVGGGGSSARKAAADVDELTDSTEELTEAQQEAADALEELRENALDLLDATEDLIRPTLDLADAYGEVESAMNDAMDTLDRMNGVEKDLIETTDDWFESMDKLADQFNASGDSNNEFVATLESSAEQGRENRDALVDMFDALQAVTLQTAIATGSQEETTAAWAAGVSEIERMMIQAGFTNEQIAEMLRLYGEFPPVVATELLVETGAAREGLETAQALLEKFADEPYEAYLAAENDAVRTAVAEALVETSKLTDDEFIMLLTADSNPFDQTVTAALLLAAGFEDAEAVATLDADDLGLRTKVLAALVDLDVISKREARAIVSAVFGPDSINMADLNAELDKIENADPVITIDADGNAIDKVTQIMSTLDGLTAREVVVMLDGDATPFNQAQSEALLLMAGFSNARAVAALDADDTELRAKTIAALVELGLISQYQARAIITADFGEDQVKVADFRAALVEIGATNANATVTVNGNYASIADAARDMGDLDGAKADTLVAVGGNGEFSLKRSADNMERIQSIGTLDVNLKTNAPEVEAKIKSVDTALTTAAKPRTATLEVVETGLAPTASKIQAQADKKRTATLDVTESNLASTGSKIDATANKRRTATINVEVSGVSSAQSAINSVQGKTVSINVNRTETTTVRTINEQANGGRIGADQIPEFASGGLRDAHFAPPSGRGLFRYAEQETGGEYFIPRAQSKRARSTLLLSQAAAEFGLSLVSSSGGTLPPGAGVERSGGAQGGFSMPVNVSISGTPSDQVVAIVERGLSRIEADVKMELSRR